MKRVFEHPPESLTGKRYWRSVGELSDTPEFRDWLEREFPSGAAQLEGDEWSRRSFLKFMGASMALAGFGLTSCRRPEAHLVPFTKSVEWAIPGKPLFYATAMPRRNGALPLVVTTHDGRPTKVDGNPLHPASGGASDLYAQASILDLYDPARSKYFVNKGKGTDRATFEKYLSDLRTKIAADGGAGLAFLVEETHSPTRERLRQELEKNIPANALVRLRSAAQSGAKFQHADGFRREHRARSATGTRRCRFRARQRFPRVAAKAISLRCALSHRGVASLRRRTR